MMSASGTVVAGSGVAAMQSAGAAGLGVGTKIVLGAVGAAAGKYAVSDEDDDEK